MTLKRIVTLEDGFEDHRPYFPKEQHILREFQIIRAILKSNNQTTLCRELEAILDEKERAYLAKHPNAKPITDILLPISLEEYLSKLEKEFEDRSLRDQGNSVYNRTVKVKAILGAAGYGQSGGLLCRMFYRLWGSILWRRF